MYHLRYFIPFLLLFIAAGCDIKEPVAPVWTVNAQIPVFRDDFTLQEMADEDDAIVSDSPSSILTYVDDERIDPVNIGTDIEFSAPPVTERVALGSIDIEQPPPINGSVMITEWLPESIVEGDSARYPASAGREVQPQQLDEIDEFEEILFDAGRLLVTLTNVNGVQITISGVRLINSETGELLLSFSDELTLPSGASETIAYGLPGMKLVDKLDLQMTFGTEGTGGEWIPIAETPATRYSVVFQNVTAEEVTAVLPEQDPVTNAGSIEMDDSTEIQNLQLSAGLLTMRIVNQFDLLFRVDVKVSNVHDEFGQSYRQVIVVPPMETVYITRQLEGYSIVSPDPQGETRFVDYTVTAQPVMSTAKATTLRKDYFISSEIRIEALVFDEFKGRLKTTAYRLTRTQFDFDLDDIYDNFTYETLLFKNPIIELQVEQTSGFFVDFNGTLSGTNGTQQRSMEITGEELIPGTSTITLNTRDVEDFLNGFETRLPDQLMLEGDMVVNPPRYYNDPVLGVGSISLTDSVAGTAAVKLPFYAAVQGGRYIDTSDVEISSEDSTEIVNAKRAVLVIEVFNAVPAEVTYRGFLLDENYNIIMNLPTSPTNGENPSISVQGAIERIGVNGVRTIEPRSSFQRITLTGSEIAGFTTARYIMSVISVNTSGGDNEVQLRASDRVEVLIYGDVSYAVGEAGVND